MLLWSRSAGGGMSVITDQWTGNGLAEATALTAGNVTTAGNFTGSNVTWSRPSPAGSPTQVTAGDGMSITSSTGTDIARIDGVLASTVTALRAQVVFTAPSATSGMTEMLILRNSTSTISHIRYDGTSRTFALRDANNLSDLDTSSAITAGDAIVIDYVAALSASPTTGNGRLFWRLKNLTDTSWNTTGYRFYDSLYTINLVTTNFAAVRWGKAGGSSGTMTSPVLWEFLGVEGITVNPADTSEQDASAYFADNPRAPYGLESGSVTSVNRGSKLG